MLSCEHVLRELSSYIDATAEAPLRQAIEEHLRGCRRCSVVLDSTRKVLVIYGDENTLEVPAGYFERLRASFLQRVSGLN